MIISPCNTLQQLRRKTAAGYLIHHPLITQAPPPPAALPPTIPPGHITARELSDYCGAHVRAIRHCCRRLPVVKFGSNPTNAYPRTAALQRVERIRQARQFPQPPPGYLSREEACAALRMSSSAFSRLKILQPIYCRSPRTQKICYYYAPAEVEAARQHINQKRKAAAHRLLSLT